MGRLSRSSVRLIKGRKGNKLENPTDDFSNLLNEIGTIAQRVLNALKSSFSRWSLTYDTIKENEGLTCTFITSHEKVKAVRLKIQVNTSGDSFLEAGIDNEESLPQGLANQISNFMKTPAAKRYFKLQSKGVAKIKAVIPKKQLVSRYFQDYIEHLLSHLEPIINSMVAYQLEGAIVRK